jgi:hypothetical protein
LKGKRLETLDLDKFASPWLILRDIDEPARLNFRDQQLYLEHGSPQEMSLQCEEVASGLQ